MAENETGNVIEGVIERWHQNLRGTLPGGLDELLADDVVFYSPVVFTPQHGKDVTKLYLGAAFSTLAAPSDATGAPTAAGVDDSTPRFRYTKEVLAGDTAVLEFETTVGGKYVNGVDIIRCDADGKIVEFRVMVRPLQAINVLHEQMRSLLEQLGREKMTAGERTAD
jgi:hypothetical protein